MVCSPDSRLQTCTCRHQSSQEQRHTMLMLLSPAKTLDMSSLAVKTLKTTPSMLQDMEDLLPVVKSLSVAALKSLFSVSDAIARLNYERYANFDTLETKQAALAFDGPAYKGLNAKSMSPADLEFAQSHLRILCGLYGVLKPLDEIKAYRLEMSNKLVNPRGKDLYAFWGDSITQTCIQELQEFEQSERFIVNCASQEYFKSIKPKLLESAGTTLYNMVFPGPSVYAKEARGAMCRYIVINRITTPEGLKGFTGSEGEWSFDANKSSGTDFVFTRGAAKKLNAKAAKPAKRAQADTVIEERDSTAKSTGKNTKKSTEKATTKDVDEETNESTMRRSKRLRSK
ncbi:hypothetical protein CYMTET_29413 [Cymbomonas tetramitiformis]|uniref:Uncharacterized protein n=1 Tax=Cymbomonas tetramitiformis TaxID=36881 RepID=A0AAE0KUZ5_9CHLO|nr:hypothetical protein CYMTET_29413 [Cymbomonas tetramitiformis]